MSGGVVRIRAVQLLGGIDIELVMDGLLIGLTIVILSVAKDLLFSRGGKLPSGLMKQVTVRCRGKPVIL
jgi:hypothetical protein